MTWILPTAASLALIVSALLLVRLGRRTRERLGEMVAQQTTIRVETPYWARRRAQKRRRKAARVARRKARRA